MNAASIAAGLRRRLRQPKANVSCRSVARDGGPHRNLRANARRRRHIEARAREQGR